MSEIETKDEVARYRAKYRQERADAIKEATLAGTDVKMRLGKVRKCAKAVEQIFKALCGFPFQTASCATKGSRCCSNCRAENDFGCDNFFAHFCVLCNNGANSCFFQHSFQENPLDVVLPSAVASASGSLRKAKVGYCLLAVNYYYS